MSKIGWLAVGALIVGTAVATIALLRPFLLSAKLGSASKSFGDGTFAVGTDVAPGIYRNEGGSRCYWERLSGFGGTLSDVIANKNQGSSQAIVAIAPSDKGFHSENCGTWNWVSGPADTNSGTAQPRATESTVIGVLPEVPTCEGYLAAYKAGMTGPYLRYARSLYVQFDEQRQASGRRSLGIPEIYPATISFWAQNCRGDPTSAFYNQVYGTYSLFVTLNCSMGC